MPGRTLVNGNPVGWAAIVRASIKLRFGRKQCLQRMTAGLRRETAGIGECLGEGNVPEQSVGKLRQFRMLAMDVGSERGKPLPGPLP